MFLAVILSLYITGYLAQLFGNYRTWKSDGSLLSSQSFPKLPIGSIVDCFKSLLYFPASFLAFLFVGGIWLILYLWIRKKGKEDSYDTSRNIRYSKEGTYGTAGFMTKEEMEGFIKEASIDDTDGIILGERDHKVVSMEISPRYNRNIAVFGASGAGKSNRLASLVNGFHFHFYE